MTPAAPPARRLRKWLIRALTLAAAVLPTIVLVFAFQARMKHPDLSSWHRLRLAEEFHAWAVGVDTPAALYAAALTASDAIRASRLP